MCLVLPPQRHGQGQAEDKLKPRLLNKTLREGTPVVLPGALIALGPLSWPIRAQAFR